MVFTGQRLEQYETLKIARRSRILSAEEYRTLKARIETAEAKHQRALARARDRRAEARRVAEEAERRRLEAERLEKEKKAKERRAMKGKERRGLLRDKKRLTISFDGTYDGDFPEAFLVPIWRELNSGEYRRVIIRRPKSDRTIIRDDTIIRGDKFKPDFRLQFFAGSDEFIMETGDRLILMAPNNITPVRIRQMFRDGAVHCVFAPIIPRIEASLANSKSKDSIQRYKQRLALMRTLEVKYSDGVPEEDMEAVAKASGYKIIINDFLGGHLYSYNERSKNGTLTFRNNRENHLDYLNVVSEDVLENVSETEMRRLYNSCLEKYHREKEHFHFDYLFEGVPKKLYTNGGAFTSKSEDEVIMEAFSERIGIVKYRLNAVEKPEINAFVKEGCVVNSVPCLINDVKPTGHLDLSKAYTQFQNYSGYDGFLGVIHEMRSGVFDRAFLEKHIGIYRCTITSCGDLYKALGCEGVVILPSVEILYLMDNGCVIEDINMGAWGSRMDFEFTDEMTETKDRYAVWSGKLGMEYHQKRYSFHSTEEWSGHLKATGYDASFFGKSGDGICTVKVNKKSVFTYHHILAFITSYTRINMMESMKKFKFENLCKVVLDGIYFTGEAPTLDLDFKVKKIKKHEYYSKWYDVCETEFVAEPMTCAGNRLLTGQGGSGKTYSVLTNTGFNKMLFVTPQHVLGADVNKKYGVNYTTIHKLIGMECTPYKDDSPYPPVLVIDEITQMPADWIDKVFEMYKESLIILAGDLDNQGRWFQCRGGVPGNHSIMWKPHDVAVVEFTEDRRSRDNDLKALKLAIRDEMRRVFVDGDTNEDILMKDWARKNLKMTNFFDAQATFADGDTWIAGTHRTSKALLALDVCSGWYKKGGYVSDVELPGYDKRGSYTIHAYQGKTVESGKIYISINDMFEYSMLYTAVSRAVHYDQLIFVV
jgi:hypothetical protein